MKNTVLGMLFGKTKSVLLALFAALCVGNVWAATYAGDARNISFDVETKTVSFTWNCYLYDTIDNYKLKAVLEYGGATVTNKVTTKELVSTRWYVMKFDKTLEDLEVGDVLRVKFSLCYGDSDANIDNTWGDDSFSYTIDTRGVLTSNCEWDVDCKKFLVFGTVVGNGIKGIKVKYKITDTELTELPEDVIIENAEYDSATGTYKIEIPYVNEKSYLIWSVYTVLNDGEEKEFKDPATEKSVFTDWQNEAGYIAYTWTGAAGDNLWSNSLNWEESIKRSLKGVPGYAIAYGYYTSKACFNTDAEVDLNGQSYYLIWEDNRGFEMSEGISVRIKNGTLGFQPNDDGSAVALMLGAKNSMLTLRDVVMPYSEANPTYSYLVKPVDGATIVMDGTAAYNWKFAPGNKDTKFLVQNGTLTTSYRSATPGAGSQVVISNGTWTIKTNVDGGLAERTIFRDGPDRPARLLIHNPSSDFTYNLKLQGTYDIKIPEIPTSYPYVVAKLLSTNATCTMNIDVSDYKLGAKVPLIRFMGKLDANTTNAMNAITTTASKLVVTANGEDVKATRNAKLVWDEADKTLYFQQASQPTGITGVTAKYSDLKFQILGNIELGYNVTAVRVNYIVGEGMPNLVKDATIDAAAGIFTCEIPYTPTDYTLTYIIKVEYADGTSKVYSDDVSGTYIQVKTRLTADNTKVIYTWTGEGDGTSWTDELNWTVNRDDVDTVGYPGTHDGSYYRTMFTIPDNVECIDLQGGTYGFTDYGAMFLAANKTVKFKNGTFRFTSSEISRTTADASGSNSALIGSNGGTLIFEKVYLRNCGDSGTESGNLPVMPRTGATVVFEGTYTDNWDYYPKNDQTGTKIIIRDGELTLSRNLNSYANGSENDVLISNAKWTIDNASTKTLTPFKTLTFRDGPDRQAQVVNTGDLKLLGTYDFAIPEEPYSTPYYTLRKLASADAGTIKVDVSNYNSGDRVPLIAFSGALVANTTNAMNTITTTASKLVVTANGVDVKAKRNAKLVWDEADKTLYFQQDEQNTDTLTIVSPADYSQVSTLSLAFKTIVEDSSLGPDGQFANNWSNPYFCYTDYLTNNSKRWANSLLYRANSEPVTLKWRNASGECVVKLWRTNIDTEDNPQFTVTTDGNSATFYDLEIGRNYTWTVTDCTGEAIGHFFTMNESEAPRILLYKHEKYGNAEIANTRDIGGYRTYKGSKVVKQGLIYRTAELEWCNPVDASGIRQELSYLKNTIGIKYDIDFRDCTYLTEMFGYEDSSSVWKWAWKNGSYLNINESNIGAGIPRLNINKMTGTQFGSYTGLVPKKTATTDKDKNNRINAWCAFTNVADSAKWPLVFHCSHGKDRTGTFALVLHGVLGVPKEVALKDFVISWFDSPDEILEPAPIASTITNLATYTSYASNNFADNRFQEQCYNYLVQCGVDAGLTTVDAKAFVSAFQESMIEDAESPCINPALSKEREIDGDIFSYATIYHRRDALGGSLGSNNGSTLNYIYKDSTTTVSRASTSSLNTYNTCLCFWPVEGLPYSSPVCGYYLVGKVVTYGRYSPTGVGPYNFKMYFSSEGHSVTNRTIIEHRSGIGDYENVDIYFTEYDKDNRGEGNTNSNYVYGDEENGEAAIEVWANATMRVRDIRDMSQKRSTKGYKAYVKFPKGCSENARFEALEMEEGGENLLGWFTGGEVGSRQYIRVVNSILQFNAPNKTSGVAGTLGFEFSLGSLDVSTNAMLQIAGTLKINDGSTVTVDAGQKKSGVYKLISAGKLEDDADLVSNSKVENCAEGHYGVIIRDGNNLNLVIEEGYLYTVTFDLGQYGERIGGGELTQSVIEGEAAIAPIVEGKNGWRFVGWRGDFSEVYYDSDVVALYEHSEYPPFEWVVSNNQVTITRYIGTNTVVNIPSVIEGFPVTVIGSESFSFTDCRIVTIPDGVTEIGDWAFWTCENLESITIPDSVTRIGDHAFCWCDLLKKVVIPKNVKEIGFRAFTYCLSLEKVLFIGDAPIVEDGVFGFDSFERSTNCTAYVSKNSTGWGVDIPGEWNGIKIAYLEDDDSGEEGGSGESDYASASDFEWDADNGYVIITNYVGTNAVVKIPPTIDGMTVACIGDSAFRDRTFLVDVILPDGLTRIERSAFYGCRNLRDIMIPAGTTYIGWGAFYGCRSFTSVEIPDNVRFVNNYAFFGCSALTNLYIGTGVREINFFTFGDCKSLVELNLPDSITSIADSAFYGCTGLSRVTIPAGVTKIAGAAFEACDNLQEFVVDEGSKSFAVIDGLLCNRAGTELIRCPYGMSNVIVPGSITNIGERAFSSIDSSIKITLPEGLKEIDSCAFIYCRGLTDIIIPQSVTSIGGSAFQFCSSLTNVIFNGNAPAMESNPFNYGIPSNCTAYVSKNSTGWGVDIPGEWNGIGIDYIEDSNSGLTIDDKNGYIITGLGELKDQAVVVFTNTAEVATWKAPKNLKNVEILVVGGGGGGGGHYYNSTAKNCQGGAGGGGGAVVAGFIKNLAADQVVNVTVGAGGAGGAATTSATTGAGKGGNGGNSVLKVGDVTYVTAYGGGGDGGYNSAGVANGGSNSGVRGTKTAANLKSETVVGEGAESLVTDIVARANKGGGGCSTSSGYPGAGGGGAMSEGGASGGSSFGGICGYGYVSMITGTRTVYGAGGGGGIGKNGGTGTYLEDGFLPFIEGAGIGTAGKAGSDGLANQGGGGGGGSYKCAGGAGGSGIVVLRFAYSDVDIPVDATANIIPKISDKAYTGEALVSGLENTYAYTVEELGERINFGQQTVRVTLNDGYVWADGDTNRFKDFTWNITQEVNNWKVEPYLSHTAWPQAFASTEAFKFTAPETSFGVLQSELSVNGASPEPFNGALPTEPGSYTLKYWVEETPNWAAKEWAVSFKIYQSENFTGGYKVLGLGEKGDEVAVVFTTNATWTVPANIKSAQFLVVGGGGGGGADSSFDSASGGAGGGGGGVVTGEVDLTKDATVTVTVGAGGAGGQMSTNERDDLSSGNYYGGSKKGGNTSFIVDGTTYVTAYGGGRDQGVTVKNSSSITTSNMSPGGCGGSNAGSRGGRTTAQYMDPQMGAVASLSTLRNCSAYGNMGGKGCSEFFYGYPSAGGGGGATEVGGDASDSAAGWPGGKGGEGLASDITGALLVYGSGGGGASTQGSLGGIGGSGAGNGGDREDSQGTSALANQGGGGGGSSREANYGGAGGSGIVVFRYVLPEELDIYSITYINTRGAVNDNPISYTIEDEIVFLPLHDIEGWEFTGWSPASIAKGSIGPQNVTANWERVSNSVTIGGVSTNVSYGTEVIFRAPEPWVDLTNGTQIAYLGTTFTAPIVTNEFALVITNDIDFTWDILTTNYWLGVDVLGSGIVSPTSGWYLSSSIVPLIATPDVGWYFAGWSGNVSTNSYQAEMFIFMTQSRMVKAVFEKCAHRVEYHIGDGVRIGGGELIQYVNTSGQSLTPPTIKAPTGWVFTGWDKDSICITNDMDVVAGYRTITPDLHIDTIYVTNVVTSGEKLDISWKISNMGNSSFRGKMIEKIELVSVVDTNDVRVIASPTFEGVVERDGFMERNISIDVPLKGWEGTWHIRIQTGINPTMQEYAANNVTTTIETVEITTVPLPNLKVDAVSGDANLIPGETAMFSFVTTNDGVATASAPWIDRIYLESLDTGKSVKVGDISRTNNIDSVSAIKGVHSLVIPELIPLAGSVRVKAVADVNDAVVESNDDDNIAYSVGTFSLATNLYLTAVSTSVYENVSGSGVRFTLKRSGPTTEAMTVAVAIAGSATVNCPESVMIPAGSVSTVFYLKPIDNATVDGPRTVTVSASAGDCRPASLAMTILDNEVPKLIVKLDKTFIREGGGVILATVTRELVTNEPMTVYLSGVSTSRCSYPSSVVIPAGEASVTFEISIPNNATAQIAQDLTLRASSSGYTSTSVTYTVEDDDVPGVTLSLTPEVVSEGAGAQAIYATLTRSDTNQIAQAVRVKLTASEANQLILPSEITIPKYTMAVRFAIGVVDNALDDGDREIEINGAIVIESCGCNGQPSNGDVIEAIVGIIDNDGPSLVLKADPATMKEGLDPAGYLILSHNSTLTEDLTVSLWVDDANEDEITIPETVTIPAGETSVRIPVATLDDGEEDGGQLVSVYVEDESNTFAPASTWVQVSDQNLPDLTVAEIEAVSSVVAMENFTVSFAVTNTGFMATSKAVPYSVHLVKGANASAVSSATLVKSGTLTGGLEVGEALNGTVTLTAPELPDDYRVAVVIDPDGTISELDSANNTGWSAVIGVTVAYTATAGVDKKVYMPGETVTITGVVSRADGTTAGNVQIDPYVMLSGMRRSLLTTTAADGSYSTVFTPTSGEAGDYTVGACYPGVNSKVAQDSFSIIGMKRSSTANVIWDIALGDSATRTVTIQNRSAVPLTGLTATFTDVPEECGFTYSLPDTIPANGSVTLSMTATADGLTDQVDYRKFYAHLTVDEGLTLDFPLYFHSQAQKAYLRATPTSINTTMAIGQTRYIEVTLVNDGKGDSGAVTVSVPSVNWLKIVSGASIENLVSGESATITLALSPTVEDGLTLNSPLSGGRMAVNCANGTGCSVPLKFTPVSEATGSITVDCVDNNTYYLDSQPHLSNATVRVSNPYTGATVATGKTGTDGIWTAYNIPEGIYQLTITAPNHDSYASGITVEPGRDSRVEAFLQYKIVSVSWAVVRNEINDKYETTLVMEYESRIPAPLIKATWPSHFDALAEGESVTFTVSIENSGVISAKGIDIVPPEIPGHRFSFSDNNFTLAAGESKNISVKFERLHSSMRLASTRSATGWMLGTWIIGHIVKYICAENEEGYNVYTSFTYGDYTGDNNTGDDELPELPKLQPDKPTEPIREWVCIDDVDDEGEFRVASSEVAVSGCKLSKCLVAVAKFIVSFFSVDRVWSCITGLIDCVDAMTDDNKSTLKALTDCGVNITKCFGVGKQFRRWYGVGEHCVLPLISSFSTREIFTLETEEKGEDLLVYYPKLAKAFILMEKEVSALEDWQVELYGDEVWLECDSDELVIFLEAVKRFFPAEGNLFDVNVLYPYKPSNITNEVLAKFVSRWNNFLIETKSNPENETFDNSLRLNRLKQYSEVVFECEKVAKEYGYDSLWDFAKSECEKFLFQYEEDQNSVCASVTLKLSQTLAMTREAFDGTLTLYNGNTTMPITNLKLDVSVLDEDGNECKDLFEIFANGTSGDMSEGSALTGGLSVTAGGTGSAMVRFIPERGAAPTEEKLYRFGGTVTYVDPFSGETATVKLTPVSLTVSPSPYLHLDYFVQRDVFADDPFTPDVVEASMPAEMAVLVRNIGGGNANKVMIASAQPEIVQNEKGLSAAFNLKDYTLEASALNGATAHLGLNTVSLGTIEPNESKVAQWWLTSTIEGHFIGMSATVAPVNSWNTPDTALVDPNVAVHKLVRSIVADGDTLPDFLVCDGSDLYGTPNEIYTAVGDQLPVYVASVASSATLPAGGEIALPLTLTPSRSGWNYGYATIPGIFRYTVSRILRSDGSEISLRNAWITDRTFRDGSTPLLEDRLHIVDEFMSNDKQTYTVYLSAKPSDVPEVVAFEGVTGGAIEYIARDAITVKFSKPIDSASFTVDDLMLMKQGSYIDDLSDLAITPADDSGTSFTIGNLSALCSEYGRYELTVQCAGIADTVGQLGSVGKSVSWTYATAEAPYVIGADGVPVHRVQSLDTISVTFSAPIKPETFTPAALRLNDVALGSGITISALDASGTRFSVSGLSSTQIVDGEYKLAIDSTAVLGLDNKSGVNIYRVTWIRDTEAPVLQALTREKGLNGNEFILTFSEEVESESLALHGATIKRNGASVALPVSASLRCVANNAPYQWVLSGVDSVLSEDGAYELTFSANGVTDEAGNVASGTKTVSWTVNRTPPAQISDLIVSPDGGFSDTDGVTYTGALTVSGTLPEDGLTVEIIAKYIGGGEIVLMTLPSGGDTVLPAGAFSQNITLPGMGNVILVVRLTNKAGYTSDTEKSIYVDGIALTGMLTGASEDEGVLTSSAVLTFSDRVIDSDVTVDRFSLTRDGMSIALEGVSLVKETETTFRLLGLDGLCAEDGMYVLRFDGSDIQKYNSGLTMIGSLVMRWRYEHPDREPPMVTEVLFDGEKLHEAYTNVFSSVSVAFSELVNVPELIDNGLIGVAARIDLLDVTGTVTGCVSAVQRDGDVSPYQWNEEANTLSWQIDPQSVPAGGARLVVDSTLVKDMADNRLVPMEMQQFMLGAKKYEAVGFMDNAAYSYACPTLHDWNGDGLLDLIVGEKTADNKGKVRIYLNRGTSASPLFDNWTYLQKSGSDVEFTAQGCVGMQVSFGNVGGSTMVLAASPGEVYGWNHLEPNTADFVRWFDHSTDSRFSSLIRTQTFCCDVDGDGTEEVLVSGQNSPMFWLKRIGFGENAVTECIPLVDSDGLNLRFPEGQNHTSAVMADMNGDFALDLVTGDSTGNVWVYFGVGNAKFASKPLMVYKNTKTELKRSRLAIGDLNGDGVDDILVGRSDGSIIMLIGSEMPSPIVPFTVKAVVSASAGIHGAIAPNGDVTYDGGDTPEYTIMPDIGYYIADVQIDGASIGVTNNYVFAPLTTSHTIHVDFAAIAYPITYTGLKGGPNSNPVTYTVEDEVVFAPLSDVEGWNFVGWSPKSIAKGSTGAITVTAQWERVFHSVNVGGVSTNVVYGSEMTFRAPEPWYDETCTTQIVYVGTTFTAPVVTNEFTVVVTNDIDFAWDILATNYWFEVAEVQNGTIDAPENGWKPHGESFVISAIPDEHYHFVSWLGDTQGCIETNITDLVVTMDQARKISAAFAIDTFVVTFDPGAHGILSGETTQMLAYGATAVVPSVIPDAGYSLTGWSGDVTAPVINDVTFVAEYAAIQYGISYAELKGVENRNPATYTIEDEIVFAPLSNVEGWNFVGWSPKSIAKGSTGAITVTAQWERVFHSVNVGGASTNVVYGSEMTFRAPEPWYDETCTTQIVYVGTTFTAPVVTNEFTVVVTNDIDFTWDILATNYWLKVNASEGGSVDFDSAWMSAGSRKSISATPDFSYRFVHWEGDVSDSQSTSSDIVILMNQARSLKAVFEKIPLTIGEAANAPEYDWYTEGDAVWFGEWSKAASDGVHAVRSGAIGDSKETVLGLRLDGAGTLSFDWRASCEERYDAVRLEVDGKQIRVLWGETSWTNVCINLDVGEHDIRWVYKKGRSGALGEDAVWIDNVVWESATEPTLAEALGEFEWETEGDINWVGMRSEFAYEGTSFAIAEGLGDFEASIIRTRVSGAGTIKFRWAVSCEEFYDWFDFVVDGEVVEMTTGETDWMEVSVELGEGDHVLEWMYWKDEMDDLDLVGANCAMLDYVRWYPLDETPPEISDKTLAAFFAWLKANNQISQNATKEDAIRVFSSGMTAVGKSATLYSEFVAGTNPADVTSEFKAMIEIDENDQPIVTPSPNLGSSRKYVVFGKKNLEDSTEDWKEVEKGKEKDYNFFKINVDLSE